MQVSYDEEKVAYSFVPNSLSNLTKKFRNCYVALSLYFWDYAAKPFSYAYILVLSAAMLWFLIIRVTYNY